MTYALDTNIILLDASNVHTVGKAGDTIVIPETVLDELDSKKSGLTEVAYQARSFGRLIAQAENKGLVKTGKGSTFSNYTLHDRLICIVTLDQYPSYHGVDRNIVNDRKIIDCILNYKSVVGKGEKITFLTNDVACGIRAQSKGLKTADLKVVERINYEFVKDYQIDDYEVFRNLHNTMIHEVDKDYKLENYSYRFTNSMSGQVKLASITNGVISVLGKETEDKLRRQNCPPIEAEQLLASRAILDPTIDLVVIEGTSGSGKNTIAVSSLMRLMSTAKKAYDKIVYIRNPVDDVGNPDEEIGFLAGNDEKQDVYLGPMEDTLQFIARNK